jgi:hypothetical protein
MKDARQHRCGSTALIDSVIVLARQVIRQVDP